MGSRFRVGVLYRSVFASIILPVTILDLNKYTELEIVRNPNF